MTYTCINNDKNILTNLLTILPTTFKKAAFTLAEMLITLGIIAIVAAMTMPSLIAKHQNKQNAVALQKAVNVLTNGFKLMMAEEGVSKMEDTSLFLNMPTSNGRDEVTRRFIDKNLKKYFKIVKSYDNTFYYTPLGKNDIGSTGEYSWPYSTYCLSDGACYSIDIRNYELPISQDRIKALGGNMYADLANILIDVNGQKKPNKWGRDFFYFKLSSDGNLYPVGGIDYSIAKKGNTTEFYWKTSSTMLENCDIEKYGVANIDGRGCGARVMEKGWIIDY